jgi:hypothetical protein
MAYLYLTLSAAGVVTLRYNFSAVRATGAVYRYP